jgi:uncharacterized protein (DUF934 family)
MIVSDQGFCTNALDAGYIALPLDCDDEQLAAALAHSALLITVGSFADGRAFSLAKRLRLLGYTGRIRLKGDVLPDQYAMARRSGIDDVEISQAHADRCQEADWVFRADWRNHDYQARLKTPPVSS